MNRNPATEPLKAGDKVVVHGEPMTVKAVVDEQPQLQRDTMVEKGYAALSPDEKREANWRNIVFGIIRKSKKLPDNAPVEMPASEAGNYIKFAYDAHGNFSLGGKSQPRRNWSGRRRQRPSVTMLAISRLAQHYFGVALQALFKKAQDAQLKAKAEMKEGDKEPELTPITQEDVNAAQAWALQRAEQGVAAPRKARRKAERARQKAARRQGFGLIPGNQAHAAFSGR